MRARLEVECMNCGKTFGFGNTNGMPNAVSMVGEDGKTYTLCQNCLIEIGKMTDEEKEKFFNELKGE